MHATRRATRDFSVCSRMGLAVLLVGAAGARRCGRGGPALRGGATRPQTGDNRWAAAAIGSMGASGVELKTGASIMAIGGFTGSDDSPTLEQFQATSPTTRCGTS